MDALLKCFFDKFLELERNTLHACYRRKATVQYFNTLIEGCCRGSAGDPQKICRDAIMAIVRFHHVHKNKNGGVCLMGKYHNILYVGLKLCYDWQLKDAGTVAALLDHIYGCEKTFERLWVGAIFGTRASHFIAGWKSDFSDQEENLRAVVYYLDHASTAGLEYHCENRNILQRFIDVPIECCGRVSPAKILVQYGVPDKLHILLRFGAIVTGDEGGNATIVESLLNRLNEFNHSYPYNLVDCLIFLLRVIPTINIKPLPVEGYKEGANVQRDYVLDHFPNLIDDGIIPINRCGIEPPDLKHLCRCQIRHVLWLNYQLPFGTRVLPIPEVLQRYLDLMD
ncbi:uncharacterized protein LOC108740670 [Agrilus planipennis]|uniref:Uncharacterized protein LOC108740670 n=1 Tax=Agrilus planipennis TaxID=224129 RepID=A0A1W4XCP7_AGRPL|nr:uncharacterized protein LOC108740670 [Agrilus planipennis]